MRARVVTSDPPEPPDGPWEALASPGYREAAGEFLLPLAGPADLNGGSTTSRARCNASTPLATLQLLCEMIPDRFEYRRGVTYVGSTVADLLEAGAGVCQDFVHLSLLLLRRQRDRRALRLRLPVGGARGRRRRLASRSTRTPGSRRCCPAPTAAASRSGSAPTRPTAGWPARRT